MIPKDCTRLADLPAASAHASAAGLRNAAQASANKLTLQEWIKAPGWVSRHEVTRVAHYRLEVHAMTKPMRAREDSPRYSPQRHREHRDGTE